jgi:hypothetical protein
MAMETLLSCAEDGRVAAANTITSVTDNAAVIFRHDLRLPPRRSLPGEFKLKPYRFSN